MAGLLQAADLPAEMGPTGDVQEGTDYDIDDAAFMANDGVRIVSRTWGMNPAAGPSIVFDFRMQFPTPEAAAAYLVAAMPTLSEATTTGLTPLTGVPAMGDETYGFGRDTQGTDSPVSIRAYLFRVGSVVAKVVAGGVGISGDQAQSIAQAAAQRVAAAGQPAPGSPRPRPTPSPTASQPAPLPSGDLTSLLLAHIPPAIASTCTPDTQRLWEGEVVTLDCRPADADVTVTYSGFDTPDHMEAAYQSSLDTIDLSNVDASCDMGTWSGTYQVEGQDEGQATCWPQQNGHAIMWSDDPLSSSPSPCRHRWTRPACMTGGWGPARHAPDGQSWKPSHTTLHSQMVTALPTASATPAARVRPSRKVMPNRIQSSGNASTMKR